ncbi:MAG TPA: ABC transporter substrate-binding protein [Burkholderiales bacterium]|nr:ABC transporter substrate-binding protein [Burkholderiales bacterium]
MPQFRRRQLVIGAAALLVAPAGLLAQSASPPGRIGLLFGSSREGVKIEMEAFVARLRELGHIPDRTVEIVARFAEGVPTRFPELAKELLDERVEVVFVPNTQGALALQRLSDEVAIIFVAVDPVRTGLIDSLAHPGRNATGFTQGAPSIAGKRVELLKDSFPDIKTLGVLLDPSFPIQQELALVSEAAQQSGLRVQIAEASSHDQYLDAVVRLQKTGVNAYYVVYTGSSFAMRRELAAAIRRSRLPAIYGITRFADDGGLIAYSWQTPKFSVLAAEYADRILRGAKPADLPVQEPTVIELVVNLATARAQGLTIPQAILLRADRVIE